MLQDATLRARLAQGGAVPGDARIRQAHDFFVHMLLSNSVLPTEVNGKIVYQSMSPEEEALCAACAECGYVLRERDAGRARVEINQVEREFEILNVLEFNSTRKRMSVIVRDAATQRIQLLCKVDYGIFERKQSGACVRAIDVAF